MKTENTIVKRKIDQISTHIGMDCGPVRGAGVGGGVVGGVGAVKDSKPNVWIRTVQDIKPKLSKELFRITQKETNKETSFALQIAHQIVNYDKEHYIYQIHKDMLKEYFLTELVNISEVIGKSYKKAIKLYNMKAIYLVNVFFKGIEMTEDESIVSSEDKYISLISEMIVLIEKIKKELKNKTDHSWIEEELNSKDTYQNIVRNNRIYKNGKFEMYYKNGYMVLLDKKEEAIYKTIVRYKNNKFVLNTFSPDEINAYVGKY